MLVEGKVFEGNGEGLEVFEQLVFEGGAGFGRREGSLDVDRLGVKAGEKFTHQQVGFGEFHDYGDWLKSFEALENLDFGRLKLGEVLVGPADGATGGGGVVVDGFEEDFLPVREVDDLDEEDFHGRSVVEG